MIRCTQALSLFIIGLFAWPFQPALADPPPKRKPGLWEIRVVSSAAQGQPAVVQQCIDSWNDDLTQRDSREMSQERCLKNDFRVSGDTVKFESICRIEGTTATTRGAFSGRFDVAYHGDMITTYDPPMMGMEPTNTTIDARWIGPCKPGQRPGEAVMPGMAGAMGGQPGMQDMMRTNPQMQEMMRNNPQMQEMMKRMQR